MSCLYIQRKDIHEILVIYFDSLRIFCMTNLTIFSNFTQLIIRENQTEYALPRTFSVAAVQYKAYTSVKVKKYYAIVSLSVTSFWCFYC